jgi:nucleotide-binding universal stress UspA family protein
MSELIVVGIDGSTESAAALAYATKDAARRGARVRVVSVNQMPEYWAMPNGMAPPSAPTKPGDPASAAQTVAQEAVDAFAADHPELAGQVPLEIVAISGHPATELVEQSREADLLVLGHRGRGAIASTFMGSVGLNCVLHAHCPVTVVRPTWAAEQVTAIAGTATLSAV